MKHCLTHVHSIVFLFICVVAGSPASSALAGSSVEIHSQPLPSASPDEVGPSGPASPGTLFRELGPERTGIEFIQPVDTRHPLKFLYISGYASAGVAIGDLDGDGLQDVFFSGGPVGNRLYLQSGKAGAAGDFSFREVTAAAGVDGGDAWGAGVALVDIDNDGDLDIYVCHYDAPNALYVNETKSPGEVRFVESASAFGLDIVDASFMPAFADYDLDGDVDLFLLTHQYVNPAGRPADVPVIEQDGRYSVKPAFRNYYGIVPGAGGKQTFTNVGRQDYLFESNASVAGSGQIRFTNVTERAGIQGLGVGNSALWWDYNEDGLPDLYIGNDFKVADQLYRNNGDGTFTDVIRETFSHTTWFSMGSDAGDINNDGMLDLLVSDMAGTTHYRSKVTMGEMGANKAFLKTAEPRQFMRNALLVNTGTPRFLEAAYMAGIAHSDWTWATRLADFDNDGRLDVYFTNGAARMFNHSDRQLTDEDRVGHTQWDLWEDTPPRLEENLAFRNLGDLRFENVSSQWGLHKRGMSYAAASGDLDNDGDLDLIVTHLDEPVSVYENRSTGGHRLRVRLVGTRSNRYGLGAVVRIETGSGRQMRQMMPMTGFLSSNEPLLHFGLGDANRVSKLVVEWPGGIRQEFRDIEADRLYTITEGEQPGVDKAPGHTDNPWFSASRTFPALRHIEQEYDDFARQPLLPYRHSQLGPGLALGDVDGDGTTDYYLARAKGSKRAVYLNEGRARLVVKSSDPFRTEQHYEDTGALFFDADKDGDRDLYVVSGGVECEPDAPSLRDRLYLNDGSGQFVKAAEDVLPDVRDSGSVVSAADYDRDGDLDLFVGGRIVPGQYPVSPVSRLLENRSQPGAAKFIDATGQIGPELARTGLVTSAIWSDADDDGWIDLLVTHEWGPVRYFRNEAANAGTDQPRRLVDRTREAGLGKRLGWWNGIAGRDLDNDGDVDYIVTNFGLNTTYQASDKKPEQLYYGEFDDSGKPHLIEAKFEGETGYPRRGMSCSSDAMPFVRDKLQTFHNFGLASLEDIYTEARLDDAVRLEVNTLESGILINLGSAGDSNPVPQFAFQPLPRLAQISPAFGVVIADFDADGWPDCFLAQNFFSPQLETGRMDSGLSLLLRGRGRGKDNAIEFDPVWPGQSGIVIPGDAKAASATDFNEDGWLDLLVTVNNGAIEAFEAQPHEENRLLRVRLVCAPGNLDCVGARVTLRFVGEAVPRQSAEVFAGGGYLSQSSGVLAFGYGNDRLPRELDIRWPDGASTTHTLGKNRLQVTIRQP